MQKSYHILRPEEQKLIFAKMGWTRDGTEKSWTLVTNTRGFGKTTLVEGVCFLRQGWDNQDEGGTVIGERVTRGGVLKIGLQNVDAGDLKNVLRKFFMLKLFSPVPFDSWFRKCV